MDHLNWANVALALVMSLMSGVGAYFLARRQNKIDVTLASEQRVRDIERKLDVLDQQVLPIATAFQAILIKQLTHYHTPKLDALLQKIGPPFALNPDEERELEVLLEERTRDVGGLIDASERDAAKMLPLVMSRVRAELSLPIIEMQLMLVAVIRTEAR